MMDVREPYRSMAWYALETLLRPYGLAPEESAEGGIWYGPEPPSESGWVFLQMDPGTPDDITRSFRGGAAPDVATPIGQLTVGTLFPGGFESGGDLIASAFYWLAGCDYRANPQRDQYGRVTAAGSLLAELGWTDRAPVDVYSDRLAELLRRKGVAEPGELPTWSLCPTFDIDYLRKWRMGILYREFVEYGLLGRGPEPRRPRLRRALRECLLGQNSRAGRSVPEIGVPDPSRPLPRDPYRAAIVRILGALDNHEAQASFFFKAGKTSAHDVGYRLTGRFLRRCLEKMKESGHDIGLHPSFHAFNHPGYLAAERHRLEEEVGEKPVCVRSHYLRWDDAGSIHGFQRNGFRIDSTLGFPDRSGFRNGTCRPFQVWDHAAGAPADLWEMPLALMESSLFNREGLSLDRALHQTRELAETVKRHGGVLVALWHNVLWDEPDFAGWGEHFVGTLDLARRLGGTTTSLTEALRARASRG